MYHIILYLFLAPLTYIYIRSKSLHLQHVPFVWNLIKRLIKEIVDNDSDIRKVTFKHFMLMWVNMKRKILWWLASGHFKIINPYSPRTEKRLVFATSIEPGQSALMCSLTRLYNVGWPTSSSHLDIPIMIMDSSINGRWIISFKKFSKLRFSTTELTH